MAFSRYSRIAFGLFAALLIQQTAHAQLAYSPFTEASVAYIALNGPGANFARANPAVLVTPDQPRGFQYYLENNLDHFDSPLQNFSLHLAVTSRLSLGVGRWRNTANTGAYASGPYFASSFVHPLARIDFGYQQDLTVGAAFQINRHLAIGLSMREEEYTTSPLIRRDLLAKTQYRTFDFGLRHTSRRFNSGIVYRNFSRRQFSKTPLPPAKQTLADGSEFTWDPLAFYSDIALEPKSAVEAGAQWMLHSRLQVLGDISSRREYALGLRLKVFPWLSLTGGRGERYDRIYKERTAKYISLGSQLHYNQFNAAVTWIAPIRRADYRFIETAMGKFGIYQLTNHHLLMGIGFSL